MTGKDTVAFAVLASVGAVIADNHFVYTSGLHGRVYVNKDALYPHTAATSTVCTELADLFRDNSIDVVVSPAVGGVALSLWTAFHLTNFGEREVLSTYAERAERSVLKAKRHQVVTVSGQGFYLEAGEELVVKKSGFVLKRGYDKLVAGKRVLIIEDILTTGGTVRQVVEATRAVGGEILAVGALCNRGNVTAEDLNVPWLESLLNLHLETWTEEECLKSGPCSEGVPVRTDIGKGADFLERTAHSHSG